MPRTPSLLRLKILDAIEAYRGSHNYGPSVRDLCGLTGHHSTSVITYHLIRLRDDGLLIYDDHVARTIALTEAGRAALHPTIQDVP